MNIIGEPIICYPITLVDVIGEESTTITVSEKDLAELYKQLEKIAKFDERFRSLIWKNK